MRVNIWLSIIGIGGAVVALVARGLWRRPDDSDEPYRDGHRWADPRIDPATDPTVAFEGWAEWDGTSFATPIAAAMIARTMTRAGLYHAPDASLELHLNSQPAFLSEFPNAKLVDELR